MFRFELRDEKLTGSRRQSILGCCTWCKLMIMAWRDTEGSLHFMFLGDSRVEDVKERDERRWDLIMRNQDFREFCMQVKLQFPI